MKKEELNFIKLASEISKSISKISAINDSILALKVFEEKQALIKADIENLKALLEKIEKFNNS